MITKDVNELTIEELEGILKTKREEEALLKCKWCDDKPVVMEEGLTKEHKISILKSIIGDSCSHQVSWPSMAILKVLGGKDSSVCRNIMKNSFFFRVTPIMAKSILLLYKFKQPDNREKRLTVVNLANSITLGYDDNIPRECVVFDIDTRWIITGVTTLLALSFSDKPDGILLEIRFTHD